MDYKKIEKLYYEKYGKTIEEGLEEYDSIFDFVADIVEEFRGDIYDEC